MYEYQLTVGLFDKDSEKQEIETAAAKSIIAETLIDKYGIFAYTCIDCNGVYRMNSTGHIVAEPSIRLEIAVDDEIDGTIKSIAGDLKKSLHQESIMVKKSVAAIDFI